MSPLDNFYAFATLTENEIQVVLDHFKDEPEHKHDIDILDGWMVYLQSKRNLKPFQERDSDSPSDWLDESKLVFLNKYRIFQGNPFSTEITEDERKAFLIYNDILDRRNVKRPVVLS